MYVLEPLPPPKAAIESLVTKKYGFSWTDVGLTQSDLDELDQIKIDKNRDLNQFGNLESLEENVAVYLTEIGDNATDLAALIARKVNRIAQEVMASTMRETGWFCLRAGVPTNKFNQPRWHVDGNYYHSFGEIQYKFVLSLVGASTLFYPMPIDHEELRKIIWIHMANRGFMTELFRIEEVLTPPRGLGAIFIAGDSRTAGFHSEPPIHENRLFFSIVPCSNSQLPELRKKVESFYVKKNAVYD